MKINALITAVISLVSLGGSMMAKLAAHDSLLLIALAVLFVQWHAQRQRQTRRKARDAVLTTMRNVSEDAALLSCSELATRHPELRCELRIFERAVVRSLADIHHGRHGAPALAVVERCVSVLAPALLKAVQDYENDRITLQSVCRQFRQMSHMLLPKTRDAASTQDTQFAFSNGPRRRYSSARALSMNTR
jgi:hypothetical protein